MVYINHGLAIQNNAIQKCEWMNYKYTQRNGWISQHNVKWKKP